MRALPFALPVLALGAVACTGPGEMTASPESPHAARPNILFLYSDDHATAAVSAYGSRLIETPNLDRIANEGVLFENAFCTNGICAPARAVILTGKHSHMNGVRDNGDAFDAEQVTFPKLLQAAGYSTAVIGKWHLKTDPTGFDHWEILHGQGNYYSPEFKTPAGKQVHDGYSTDVVTDHALDWLDAGRDPEKPFLLMCQFKAPHRNWMPAPRFHDLFEGVDLPEPSTLFDDHAGRGSSAREQEMSIAEHMHLAYDLKVPLLESEAALGPDRWATTLLDRLNPAQREAWDLAYEPRNAAFRANQPEGDGLVRWKYQRYIKDYLRCIAAVDDNVGRILDHLEASGLADSTIVVYSSDQGFFLGEHGWYDKRFMYEPALRLPLMVRWPGVTPGQTRDAHLVQNLDLAQTFLEAAGVADPSDMQGMSLVPLLEGNTPTAWRSSIYYEYFEEGIHNVSPHHGIRTDRWKLIRFPARDEWELYDLQQDPEELHNLASEPAHASALARLQTRLHQQRMEAGVDS